LISGTLPGSASSVAESTVPSASSPGCQGAAARARPGASAPSAPAASDPPAPARKSLFFIVVVLLLWGPDAGRGRVPPERDGRRARFIPSNAMRGSAGARCLPAPEPAIQGALADAQKRG